MAGWSRLFFRAHSGQLLPGPHDDRLGVLFDQGLKLGVAGQRFFQQGHLLGRDVARHVLAVLPALEFVIGRGRTCPVLERIGRELAALHERDISDLGQQVGK